MAHKHRFIVFMLTSAWMLASVAYGQTTATLGLTTPAKTSVPTTTATTTLPTTPATTTMPTTPAITSGPTTTTTTTTMMPTTTQANIRPDFVDLNALVFTLKESEKKTYDITNFKCQDPNNKKTKVTLNNNFTSSYPCSGCFSVIPCLTGSWCLRFNPSFGSLDMDAQKTYDFQLTCQNADGQLTTQGIEIRVVRDTKPPDFTVPAAVTLLDSEKTTRLLHAVDCTDGDVGQTVKMSVANVQPWAGKCAKCFAIFKCNTVWCLRYVPSGTLDYASVKTYTVTLQCTDSMGLSVQKDIDINIDKNTPPVFDPNLQIADVPIADAMNTKKGDVIYTVKSKDNNKGDVLRYRLQTEKDKDDFEIDLTTGVIRAKKDLSSACYAATTLKAYVSDGVNPEVGPLFINTQLTNSNAAPSITNLDFAKQVPEDTGVNGLVYEVKAKDDGKPSTVLQYTMTSNQPDALSYFKLGASGKIVLNKALDYDNHLLRQKFQLVIQATDGSCLSEKKTLTIDITDVNEKPEVVPNKVTLNVDEGHIDIDPSNWKVEDPDFRDSHTYKIIGGNTNGFFDIDSLTGRIMSTVDNDVDPNRQTKFVSLKVEVTDRGGLKDTFSVNLNIRDINDNRPVIQGLHTRSFTVTNCTRPGFRVAKLTATDRDSAFRDNDKVSFIGQSATGPLTVLSNGEVVLTSRMAPGATASVQVQATDQGKIPHPLTSTTHLISVVSKVCPPPPPPKPKTTKAPKPPVVPKPVTAAPTTTKRTTTTTTTKPTVPSTTTTTTQQPTTAIYEDKDTWFDDNLPWIILSGLLGTILFGLLTYFCLRYIFPWCQGVKCCKPSPRTAKVWPVKEKNKPAPRPLSSQPARELTPVEKVDIQIRTPSPPPPAVVGPEDGVLTDFWKEHYNEDDFFTTPKRNVLPQPTKDAVNPLTQMAQNAKPDNVPVGKQNKGCVVQ